MAPAPREAARAGVNARGHAGRSLPAWLGPRQGIGLAIALLGAALALGDLWRLLAADPRVVAALAGGMVAAGATALGTVPVMLSQRVSQRTADAMLGFGAGIMLAATSFSLVAPALAAAQAQGAGRWGAGAVVGAGIALGAALLLAVDAWLPSSPLTAADGDRARALRRAWIFVGAISLHNIPEGLAIGVGFAGTDASHAHALATGISIQDVPEGLVVALALRGVGYGRLTSVGLGIASGLVEPLAAVAGAAVVAVSVSLLPWGLAVAAGAMLYAVSHEAIPGAQQQGNARFATAALVLGFVLMMLLDTALSAPAR